MMIAKFLKWLGLIIALIGLFLGLLDLVGAFSHPDREHMVQVIRSKGKVPSSNPAFSDFIKKYPPPKGWKETDITGLAPSTSIKSGGVVTPTGPLIYVGIGKQTRRVATFDDIIEWSQESSYPWISWIVTAVGWLICGIGLAIESFGSKKSL